MARPTKLTKELKDKILKYIRGGMNYTRACSAVGISETNFYNWKKAGELKKSPIYIEFFEDIKKATSEFEAFHVNIINNAARDGTWQASAWMLERKFPKEYGRQQEQPKDNSSAEVVKELIKALREF